MICMEKKAGKDKKKITVSSWVKSARGIVGGVGFAHYALQPGNTSSLVEGSFAWLAGIYQDFQRSWTL